MRTKNSFMAMAIVMLFAMIACGGDGGTKTDDVVVPAPANFLALSDIHFNPLYDPSLIDSLMKKPSTEWKAVFETSKITDDFGYYGWSGKFLDTGYPLFKSAMSEIKKANPSPDFITINGDFLAHEFEGNFQTIAKTTVLKDLQDFTVKTMEFIVSSIEEQFPGVPILPTLGNNDAFCGDYEVRTPGSFLTRTAPIFEAGLNGIVDSKAFNDTYQKGGYFVAKNPKNPKHKIISLNTVMLSKKYMDEQDYCGTPPDSAANSASAAAQFTWLENELKDAEHNGEKVWIMYHIPPGFDVYNTIKDNKGVDCKDTNPVPFYHSRYNDTLISITNRYQPAIAAQLGGHTHMDNFMVIDGDTKPTSFVHIQPSITPINFNNPGFIEYTFDSGSGELKDYNVHGFNNVETATTPDWKKEYTFSTVYKQDEINMNTLKTIYTSFQTDTVARKRYEEYYVVEDSASANISDVDWKYYYCAFGNQKMQDYNDCLCNLSK